jgi:hypothetical protein
MSASGCSRAKASSEAGSRAVATTWSPFSRSTSANVRPNPAEAPVINQRSGVMRSSSAGAIRSVHAASIGQQLPARALVAPAYVGG